MSKWLIPFVVVVESLLAFGCQGVLADGLSPKQQGEPANPIPVNGTKSGTPLIVKESSLGRLPGDLVENSLVVSLDGKRFAYFVRPKLQRRILVLDGVQGKEFDTPPNAANPQDDLMFSPDSQHLAARVHRDKKAFVSLDGVEGKAYEEVLRPVFSPDSKRLAYVAVAEKGKVMVVVDGVERKAYTDIAIGPVFSPDSKHVAYGVQVGAGWKLVVNGSESVDSYDGFLPTALPRFAASNKVSVTALRGRELLVVEADIANQDLVAVNPEQKGPEMVDLTKVKVEDDPGTLVAFRGQVGKVFYFKVAGSAVGSAYGTDIYTDDSRLATAAVHAGVLKDKETGVVKVTILAGQAQYLSSTQNGVTSSSWGSWVGSFKVEAVAGNGSKIRPGGGEIEGFLPMNPAKMAGDLKSEDAAKRKAAAAALEKLGPKAKEAVPALVEALKDKDEAVAEAVAQALFVIDPENKALEEYVPRKASVDGKYTKLLRKFAVPLDKGAYGEFRDYGSYSGTSYAGVNNLPAGYWVYVYPHWYIWGELKMRPELKERK